MLILLSPAKTMTGTSKIKAPQGTTPRFQQEANEIALHMTQFPIDELSRILKLSPKDFTEEDFLFSQEHMRFVSGCYGLLRPLDLIKPYRMEFDVKIPELGDGNMYAFWKDRQTNILIHDVRQGDGILLNLASLDIQPSFQWKEVERSVRIITPEFKIWKNGKAETIVIYAKMCRGQMSRYLIKNRISDPETLKAFTWEGFSYKESMSEGDNWVFLQE